MHFSVSIWLWTQHHVIGLQAPRQKSHMPPHKTMYSETHSQVAGSKQGMYVVQLYITQTERHDFRVLLLISTTLNATSLASIGQESKDSNAKSPWLM